MLNKRDSARFWPIYDEYVAEMNKVGDRRVKLITDYAASRDSMSQDEAMRLLKEALDVEKQRIEVKEDFIKKFNKELSARTTARFYHIESKLDAIGDVMRASKIPLIY